MYVNAAVKERRAWRAGPLAAEPLKVPTLCPQRSTPYLTRLMAELLFLARLGAEDPRSG